MNEGALPGGTVTFLLTDIEGSTKLWQDHRERMGEAVERHVEVIETAVSGHGGMLVKSKGEGDSTFSVFARPTDAVAAAAEAQRTLGSESWPSGIDVCVRAAVHTGEAELRDDDYYGTTINRCARLRAVAHGGQTICSQVTADLVTDGLPQGVGIRSLGTHRLKDLERSEQVFQISRADFPEEFPPLRSLDAFRHNLPTQRTSFVGREDEIRIVRKHLEHNRIVTLTGVGGCGKTRLALQAAAELIDDFGDGVFLVELGPLSDPEAVPTGFARAIGLTAGAMAGATSGPVRDSLLDALTDRETLLVLDNCEHLIDACAEIADVLLDACSKLRILATSREALEVEGEQTHTVRSLEVPRDGDVEACESVRLFADRASAVREGFVLAAENAEAVAEICRHLDGIPLALELAAAQVSHLSPQQIVQRLDDRFALLTGGRRRVQRQQTLQATLDWSHDLLSDDERTLLRRLAVFPGSFTLDAAEAVGGEGLPRPVETLRTLVSKSLVVTEEGADLRYRLLETVRLYAEEKLLASGESEGTRSRHRDHVLTWAEALDPEDAVTWAQMRAESHNLLTALVWAEREGRLDLVGRLAGVVDWYSLDPSEGVRWLTRALEGLDELTSDQRVRLLVTRSFIGALAIDDAGEMRSVVERAIADAPQKPSYWLSCAYSMLCFLRSYDAPLLRIDLREEVEGYARRALELSAGPGSRWWALFRLGYARTNTGDLEGAIELLEEARRLPADRGSSWVLSFLYHLAGRSEEASARADANLALRDDSLIPDWRVGHALPAALALAAVGRHGEALGLIRDEMQSMTPFRVPGSGVAVAAVLGAMCVLREDWERASVLFGSVRACFDRLIVRSPIDIALYQRYVPKVREALGAERGRELRDRGYAMPIDEAVALGLEP